MATTTTTQRTAASAALPTTIHIRARHTSTPTMADPSAPPAAAADTLTCKACGRTLATISADGELQPHGALREGCALCMDMVMHCREYDEVKGYFGELAHRRDDYRPRQLALEVVHEAQMKLGNFIQAVAEWGDEGEDEDEDEPFEGVGSLEQEQTETATATATATAEAEPANAQPRHKRPLSPASSPPRKRAKRSRLSERQRRVGFDPSVVFRDAEAAEKRVDAEFSRNSEGYSPGRYAAPEGSEWLDTSGNSLRETQFFGVQKRGQKWVPTKEGIGMDEEWERGGGEAGVEHGEEKESMGHADEDQGDRGDGRMELVVEEADSKPSSDITLPHRTLAGWSDPSSQSSGPDPTPSSDGVADIQVHGRPSIFGDGTPRTTPPGRNPPMY
ncbi:hypothetical protein PMIN07_000224 [Paraphaeosphaeria minitans]